MNLNLRPAPPNAQKAEHFKIGFDLIFDSSCSQLSKWYIICHIFVVYEFIYMLHSVWHNCCVRADRPSLIRNTLQNLNQGFSFFLFLSSYLRVFSITHQKHIAESESRLFFFLFFLICVSDEWGHIGSYETVLSNTV